MDIDQLMYTAVSKDNDRETLTNFLMSQGPRESANEHLIPEQLFDDPNTEEKEVEGVSAVKALKIAASEGQTIYTITRENYNEVLPKLNLQASTLTDINNAMWAGRVVTVHENSISYKGWRGDGYSIVDPTTGAGAYLINGGANGAFLVGLFIGHALKLAVLTLDALFDVKKPARGAVLRVLGGELIPMIAAILLPIIAITSAYIYAIKDDSNAVGCLIKGIGAGYGVRTSVNSASSFKPKQKGMFNFIMTLLVTFGVSGYGASTCIK